MSPTSHEADLRISRSITVAARPATIFAVSADPRRHHETDGSGTVRRPIDGPERLTTGSRFGDGTHVRGGRAGASLLRAIRAPQRNAVAIEGTLAPPKQLVE
jgi:hypothetical protein